MNRPLAGLLASALLATSMSCGLLSKPRPGRGEVRLDPPGAGTSERPLPLGEVELVDADIPCADNALPGAKCQRLSVSCPDLPTVNAELAITRAAGEAKGTFFAHRGADGTIFFDEETTLERTVKAGFDVVQVRWQTDWEQTPRNGILKAGCRPATLLQHVFETVHGGDRDRGFCGVGHSGGGGALGYALAHYGRGAILDYAVIASGPPFSRIDYGCAPSTWKGGRLNLCPALEDAPTKLPAAWVDPWENTWTCGDDAPHPDDLARWKADSIVSPGADHHYPNTLLDFYNCATDPNGTAGGAYFWASEITSEKAVTCFTDCRVEFLGDAGWARIQERMVERCVPRHGNRQ